VVVDEVEEIGVVMRLSLGETVAGVAKPAMVDMMALEALSLESGGDVARSAGVARSSPFVLAGLRRPGGSLSSRLGI
jgi:hypothetical protein